LQPSNPLPRDRRRQWLLAGALVLAALVPAAAALAWHFSVQRGLQRLGDVAAHQLDLYAAVLESEVAKQADLPGLVDAEGEIEALLRQGPGDGRAAAVNRRLARFAARSGALDVLITDAQGQAMAASNWFVADPPLGRNLHSEPCVAEALGGYDVRRFAPDADTGSPRVCFGRALTSQGRLLGALRVRTSLDPIEASWVDAAFREEAEKPVVIDRSGVVVISSVPVWKRLSLPMLVQRERILDGGGELVRLRLGGPGAPSRLMTERPIPSLDWRLVMLSDTTAAWRDARSAAWGAAALAGCAGLIAVAWWLRQRNIAQKLASQEALRRANDELEAKVRERTEALLQAGKLALLGQMSAGISHELGQPLTALRALADNGRVLLERGQTERAAQNLRSISELTERMGRITSQLKSFVRKAPSPQRELLLADALANTQIILAPRLRGEDVALHADIDRELRVRCDVYRLEQVLLNLMANAIDAMRGLPERVLTVSAQPRGDRVVVRVSDTGPGLTPEQASHMFEPFFTTKPPGEGLGLGLVISAQIVGEFGGELRAVPGAGGAVFEFDLASARSANDDVPSMH
jgi:two-component system C4-dicarboxylate transport sensor histidine kinase DctB